jgi:hypothetical protein
MPKNPTSRNSSSHPSLRIAIIFSVCFLISEFIISSFHEFWRDEIQAWSVAFQSHSLSELFFITRFEGHGKLYYVSLYIIQHFTDSIASLKVINITFATFYAFVFYYFSPFKTVEKILFCFGYYFFFEYGIICRDYSLEILLLFLTTVLYLNYSGRYILLNSLLFFLLFQINIYGVILGIVLYGYIIFNLWKTKTIAKGSIIFSLIIVFTGLIISIYYFIPPPDLGFANKWVNNFDSKILINVLTRIFAGYFPFPEIKIKFWNTNFTEAFPDFQIIQLILALIVLVIVSLIFSKKRKVLLFFYAGTIGLMLFSYFKYYGYQRHFGQLFLLFVLCLWIYIAEDKSDSDTKLAGINYLRMYFLYVLLIVNLSATFVAVYYEINYPFSNAFAVAQYLKANSLDTMNIGGDEYNTSSISGLLNKPIYYPQTNRMGTYILFSNKRTWLSSSEIIEKINSHFAHLNQNYLLILSYPVEPAPLNWQFIRGFDSSIVGDENYFIYKIKPNSSLENKELLKYLNNLRRMN